jgi:uncharacterized membrane protein
MVRKMVIAVALAAGFFGVQSPAWAGLWFQNNTSETISIAVTYEAAGAWRSIGWYTVKSGQSVQVIGGNLDLRYYYFYAYTASGRQVWTGDSKVWVHPTNAFDIHFGKEWSQALPAGAKLVGFQRIDVGNAQDKTFDLGKRKLGPPVIIDKNQ